MKVDFSIGLINIEKIKVVGALDKFKMILSMQQILQLTKSLLKMMIQQTANVMKKIFNQ